MANNANAVYGAVPEAWAAYLESPSGTTQWNSMKITQMPIATPGPSMAEVEAIFLQLPHPSRSVVAGSAAIAPETSDDIDIWVKDTKLIDYALEASKPKGWIYCGELTDYLPAALKEQIHVGKCFLAAATEGGLYRKVHLFQFKPGFIYAYTDILKRFDCSCHAWYWSPVWGRCGIDQSTYPVLQPIKTIHVTDPARTNQRIKTFDLRYGTQSELVPMPMQGWVKYAYSPSPLTSKMWLSLLSDDSTAF